MRRWWGGSGVLYSENERSKTENGLLLTEQGFHNLAVPQLGQARAAWTKTREICSNRSIGWCQRCLS